jgi:hypothetical protein
MYAEILSETTLELFLDRSFLAVDEAADGHLHGHIQVVPAHILP